MNQPPVFSFLVLRGRISAVSWFLLLFSFFVGFTSCKSRKSAEKTNLSKVENPKIKPDSAFIFKDYSDKLGIEVDSQSNIKLIELVIDWLGTPYQYGACSKKGTDCSGFANMVYREIYGLNINRSSQSIYEQCRVISMDQLKEGDFVFFKIEQSKVSHVGIYLRNNKFVHASTKRGVIINDLNEPYYRKYFFRAGTLLY